MYYALDWTALDWAHPGQQLYAVSALLGLAGPCSQGMHLTSLHKTESGVMGPGGGRGDRDLGANFSFFFQFLIGKFKLLGFRSEER